MSEHLVTTAANVGFTTAAAAYLLWWTTKRLNGKLQRTVDKLGDVEKTMAIIADKLDEILQREERILERLAELKNEKR